MSETVARHVRVHGTVQGVFFRDSTWQQAEERGVAGWVRNRDDGTVEAHLEGAEDDVRALVAWLHEGPPRAVVQRVDDEPADPEGHTEFVVR